MQLSPGDRVALLVPGSVAYVELVLALLRRGVFPDPDGPAADAGGAPAAVRRPGAAPRGDRPGRVVPALLAELGPATGCRSAARSTSRAARRDARRACTPDCSTRPPPPRWSREEQELWGFAADDVNLVLSPLHHSAPLRFALGTLLAGGRVVAPGPFDPATVTAAIAEHRPTTMFCVPAHLQRLFAHWDGAGVPDLSSFRLVAHAGAPCPPAVKRAAGRGCSRPARRGSSTGPRRGSSPPAAARSGASGRAPSAGPGRGAR